MNGLREPWVRQIVDDVQREIPPDRNRRLSEARRRMAAVIGADAVPRDPQAQLGLLAIDASCDPPPLPILAVLELLRTAQVEGSVALSSLYDHRAAEELVRAGLGKVEGDTFVPNRFSTRRIRKGRSGGADA